MLAGVLLRRDRSIAPIESAVVTVGKMENSLNSTECGCGSTFNVIADSIVMHGTARSFKPEVRETVRQRVGEVAAGVGAGQGAEILTEWDGACSPPPSSHPSSDTLTLVLGWH